MAKGFGAIMAEVAAAKNATIMGAAGTVLCPLCGKPMELSPMVSAWFCYDGSEMGERKCTAIPALEAFYGGSCATQGQVLGVIAERLTSGGPVILVELMAVRGGFGRTNIKVAPTTEASAVTVPTFCRTYEWLLSDAAEAAAVAARDSLK